MMNLLNFLGVPNLSSTQTGLSPDGKRCDFGESTGAKDVSEQRRRAPEHLVPVTGGDNDDKPTEGRSPKSRICC